MIWTGRTNCWTVERLRCFLYSGVRLMTNQVDPIEWGMLTGKVVSKELFDFCRDEGVITSP